MFNILKGLLGEKKDTSIVLKRSDMLRHTEFYQFEPMEFSPPTTPHDIHKRIQEYTEDAGAFTYVDIGPKLDGGWHMALNPNGAIEKEYDYQLFSGVVSGNVKLDYPEWTNKAIFWGALTFWMMGLGLVFIAVAYLYRYYLDLFARGEVHVLYNGTYSKTNEIKGWKLDLDVMVSYTAQKEVGGNLVQPIFENIVTGLRKNIATDSKVVKSLPRLYSAKPSDFNSRFPVNIEAVVVPKLKASSVPSKKVQSRAIKTPSKVPITGQKASASVKETNSSIEN